MDLQGKISGMKYLSDRMTALRAKTRLTEVTKDGDSDAEGGPRNPEARQGPKGFEPPRVEIPIRDCSPDSSEISHFQTRGRFLARQDCWDELSRIIAEADSSRSVTSGGTPVARLYAQGAHADALESALAAVDRCDPTSARRILYSLRDAIEGVETDPYLAIIAAQAHLGQFKV